MKLSVIIPTRNRALTLTACLSALTKQTLPKSAFEVIVVDNGSTDNTPEVLGKFTNLLELTSTTVNEPGLHLGRHAGLGLARTDVLVYADDDIVPMPTWLEAIARNFTDQNVVMVGGNNYPAFQQEPPAWLHTLWNRPVYRGRALGSLSILDFGKGRFAFDPRYVWGCNFSIRKGVLLDARGFHPDAFPDACLKYRGDGESHVSRFVRSRGVTAVFDSDASVNHLVPTDRMSKEYFSRRYFAQGISYSYASIRAARGKPGVSHQLGNLARRTRSALTRTLQKTTNLIRNNDNELPALMEVFHRSYWDGYHFHMRNVRQDRALLDWVLKADYL